MCDIVAGGFAVLILALLLAAVLVAFIGVLLMICGIFSRKKDPIAGHYLELMIPMVKQNKNDRS